MSSPATLLGRVEALAIAAVANGDIGIVRSLRLHLGGPEADLPDAGALLDLGDAIFACPRRREVRSGSSVLCVWEKGQVATTSAAPAPRIVLVLTILGSAGAIHFSEASA